MYILWIIPFLSFVFCDNTSLQTVLEYFQNRPLSWEIDHDNLCEVNGRAFTGVRVLGEHKLVQHEHRKLVITECRHGLSVSHAVLHANESLWNRPIELIEPETNERKEFELKTRDVYKTEQLRYISGTIVGGIFTVQRTDNSQVNASVQNNLDTPNNSSKESIAKHIVPFSPLMADSWSHCYTHLQFNSGIDFELLDPLLRSPDQLDDFYPQNPLWASEMFPNLTIFYD